MALHLHPSGNIFADHSLTWHNSKKICAGPDSAVYHTYDHIHAF
jgi:hypothetical protein